MSRRSELYEIQQRSGAQFTEFHGWELPEKFTDPLEEHLAVRESVGIIDLVFRGKLELTGEDRVRFLNALVSNDVKSVKPGNGIYAALLTVHGKLVADLRVYGLEGSLLIDLADSIKDKTIAALNQRLVADRVEIKDISDICRALSLQGPKSGALLDALLYEPLPAMQDLQHVERELNGLQTRIIKVTHTGEEGYDLLVATGQLTRLWGILAEKGSAFGLKPVGMAALNTLRIEAGIPWYGVDMDESHILLEAGLEQALSTTKGCYLGQETIARIIFRGHVNKKLVGIRMKNNTVPAPKDRLLHEGTPVGVVTSGGFSPSLNAAIALAYVRRDYLQPGTPLMVEAQGAESPAEVVALPFYKRET
jgi:glycine cleavage system T protein